MRNTLFASAAILGLALCLPAFAQTATDPNPANPSAIKDGTPAAGTGSGAAPGNDPVASSKTGATLGAKAPQNDPGPLGNTSNPSPASSSGSSMSTPATGTDSASPSSSGGATDSSSSSDQGTATPKPKHLHHRAMSNSDSGDRAGHWAHQPGSGMSGPASSMASNIDSADTRSAIAPHLPSPRIGQNAGPDRYLREADRALKAHKTGEAQQALEMAETRLLDRSTEAGSATQPDQDPRIAAVSAARKALASKDWAGARQNIQTAMNTGASASESTGGSGGMASGSAMQGGMSSTSTSTTSTGGAMSSGGNPAPTGAGTTGSGNAGSVANGNAGTTPAPMDPTGQGPATTGAAGTPTTGAANTAPNQMQPASGAK